MFFDYLQGQLSGCGQVDSSESFSGPASVLKEVYIKIPVLLVLYRPVPTCQHIGVRRLWEILITDVASNRCGDMVAIIDGRCDPNQSP